MDNDARATQTFSCSPWNPFALHRGSADHLDTIIGRLFVDGIVPPVFTDDAGAQYVTDADGQTRRYGTWLLLDEADAHRLVSAAKSPA